MWFKSWRHWRLQDLQEGRKVSTHGMSHSPTWRSWCAMVQRVTNPRHAAYKDYGARGIDVDPRWRSFQAFLDDMGIKPAALTLERRDNERGYWPDNCYWASRREQASNRRSSKYIVVNGERMTQAELARRAGCTPQAIYFRLKQGWTPEQMLLAPDPNRRYVQENPSC